MAVPSPQPVSLIAATVVVLHQSDLPGQSVPPVAVDLPLADGSDQQTLPPPHLLALLNDVAPQPAGQRGAAQTLSVQLAKDLHAHFRRQRLSKVFRRDVAGGYQGGSSFRAEKHRRGRGGVMLHDSSECNSLKQPVPPVNRGEAPSSTRPAVQMSGFDLLPVDGGGGEPIHLPPGETVLGRGPLLGVSDKRVSRLHGRLENLNGELRIKPTHLNPCFVQSSLTDDPRPLQRDVWFPLQDGDLFSLMPGQFIYRVETVGGGQRTPRNSQMFEAEEKEEEELLVSPEPDVEPPPAVGQTPPQDESTPAAPSEQQEAASRGSAKGESAQPKEEEEDKQNLSVNRRRILPAWMMAAASHSASSSHSYSIPKGVKRSKGPSSSTKAAKQSTPTKTSSPEEELSEEEMPKKRRRKMSDEEQEATPSKTDVPSEQPSGHLQSESNRSEISKESDCFPMEEDEEEREPGTSAADTETQTKEISQAENEEKKKKNGRQQTKRAEARLRTPCPYGKDCYRKNPMHFQESSHPGDTDYEEEEEEDETQEEDLPECPYGTDCYRKNPLHRKEYKHTKIPGRSTRTVHKKVGNDDDGDDDDEEDEYDNSFIDDDSEDAGDDSDYKPPASDDSGKEDIKELQKEAKTFIKRRK